MRCVFSFILLCLVSINANAFDYDHSFLAEVKPKISEQCYKGMASGGKSLREFIVHAVSVWNARTPGLMNGSHDYTGNYEECLGADSSAGLAQYCVFDVAVTYEGRAPNSCRPGARPSDISCSHNRPVTTSRSLKWALCAVSSCSKSNLLVLAEVLMQKSDIGRAGLAFNVSLPENTCQTSAKPPFRTDTIVFFYLIGAIALMVTLCTIWDWCHRHVTSHDPDFQAPALVRNWSIIENFSSLTETSSGEIKLFNSVKVITMCIIISSHEMLFMTKAPLVNLDALFIFLGIFRDMRFDLSVDAFFAMGGFIAAYTFLSLKDKNIFELALSRYFRIVPVYALVIFYTTSVFEYTGSGPFWPSVVALEKDSCIENWWSSLLMLGNYVGWEQHCLLESWYVPCDFHFYIVAILMCRLIKKNETLGVAALSVLLVASIVYVGAVIGYENWSVILPALNDTLREVRSVDMFQNIYIRSHFRISSYIMGMLGACAAHVCSRKKMVISKRTAIGAFLVSIVIMASAFVSGKFYGSEVPYSAVRAALYGALFRPVYLLGFVIFILTFMFGKIHFPKLAPFFETKLWIPLSRLTFSMYLLHMTLLYQKIGSQVQPFVFQFSTLVVRILWNMPLYVVAALVLYLCVEKPSYGLFKLALGNYRKWRKPKPE